MSTNSLKIAFNVISGGNECLKPGAKVAATQQFKSCAHSILPFVQNDCQRLPVLISALFSQEDQAVIVWVSYRVVETPGQHVTVQQHPGTCFQNTEGIENSCWVSINY